MLKAGSDQSGLLDDSKPRGRELGILAGLEWGGL
jgi:hypothetical protein